MKAEVGEILQQRQRPCTHRRGDGSSGDGCQRCVRAHEACLCIARWGAGIGGCGFMLLRVNGR